jgi:transcriptional regulator GlxA family with amidase domain
MTHRVVGLLVGEVVTFDLGIADQVFGRTPGYSWRVCGPRRGWLPTETGLAVRVDHGLDVLADADTVVVPGIGDRGWPPPTRVLEALRTAHRRGARVVSVCTGAFVLGAAGLLDGRRATTHWAYADQLSTLCPDTDVDPGVLFVDEGSVCTSAGLAAGIDLCLHLVAKDFGAERAAATARRMVVPPRRQGGQAQFIESVRSPAAGPAMGEVLELMERRFAEPWTVAGLAAQGATSERSFARRFRAQTGTTPTQWLISRRVEEARRLLETTHLSIDQIATRVGFGTPLVLRQHFRRVLHTTPTDYRRAFALTETVPAP